jgi:hypothetical protein
MDSLKCEWGSSMSVRIAVVLLVFGINSINSSIIPGARAKDFLLTIGGGYDPTGNQLSLERNVVFQQKVIAEQRPDKPPCEVYFADGDNGARDLQCRDPEFDKKCPAARRMMAEIFGDTDSMDLVYRNHEVPNERGPSDKSLIRRRMRELARQLKAGDRLIIYVTGHGSPAERASDGYEYEFDDETQRWKAKQSDSPSEDATANAYNTSFYLWDSESVSVSEFVAWLDRLGRDVQVVLVMVQCYAGGFAHTIFHEANADLGLSPQARCGFFAQVHDRGAAGCTADANEADYEEYSSYFWGALGGHTRTGESITSADYDGNGKVSFAEAHSYAVLESNTIDIPVRTTGALLRGYSHVVKELKKEDGEEAAPEEPFGRFLEVLRSEKPKTDGPGFVELTGPLSALAANARPDQRAILERLPAKLGMVKNPTVEEVRRRLRQTESKTKASEAELSAGDTAYTQLVERVQNEVREIWPELNATYAPLAMELASDRADEFVKRVRDLPSYQALQSAAKRQADLSDTQLELARAEARLQRLLQTCEDVALRANLPKVAPAEIVTRYEKLLAMEEGTLVP